MTDQLKHIALEGKGLTLGYLHEKSRKEVVQGLDFQLLKGELTCLLGPNGVGKSTLVKAIMGQIMPWRGELLLEDKPLSDYDPEELAKRVSVVLTDPVFPGNMTVGELVALGRTPYTGWTGSLSSQDREIVEQALQNTKIEDLRDERLSEISDGQRQKAMIARALAQDGQLMVLDEPTAHLDLVNRFEVMQLLRDIAAKKQKSVLVVTHDLDIAVETADRFWLMSGGSPLVTGKPEDLIISGQINLLLPSEKYQFSLERGKLEFDHPDLGLVIFGPKELAFWLKKALIKENVENLEAQIFINSSPFSITYKELNFDTITDFVQHLKHTPSDTRAAE
jgi:iron complex transport system ATP-binding protein